MDIQEAIEHARQVAEGCDAQNRDCAYQHDKLADWLTVLKQIAEIFNCDPNDPAQLKWLCYKLRDWQQAEQDGRLVVLPCKKGNTLWAYYNYPTTGIRKMVATDVSTLNGKIVINTDAYGVISESDIGKTVFLTRQEAEAAVEKGADT